MKNLNTTSTAATLAAMSACIRAGINFNTAREAVTLNTAANGGELAKKLAVALLGQEVATEVVVKLEAVKVAKMRSIKLRKSTHKGARHGGRKAPFQRFAGSLLGTVNPVKGHTSRPSVASKVAEVLIASAKPIAAFRAAASKVQGWTKEVAALNAAYQDAVAAAKSAVAAL